MRRTILQCFSLIILSVLQLKGNPDKPNLLIIHTDEHNFRTLGCYRDIMSEDQAYMWGTGYEVETPNIDRIAKEGAICTRYYVSEPVCTPSRASMISGLYPHATGAYKNGEHLLDGLETFATILKNQGYATSYIGKWHLDGEDPGNPAPTFDMERDFGFTDNRYMMLGGHWPWFDLRNGSIVGIWGDTYRNLPDEVKNSGEIQYVTDWFSDRALEVLEKDKDQPFCMMLSIPDPHSPNDARSPYDEMYNHMDFEMPVSGTIPYDRRPNWGKGDPETDDHEYRAMDSEYLEGYFGMVKCIDYNVGRLLKFLDDNSLTENTIVVFTADHGDMLFEHNRDDKGKPYEASAKVPFVIRYPNKIMAGKVIHTPYVNVDFAPTILELMGAPEIPNAHGYQDAQALLLDEQVVENDRIVYFQLYGGYFVTGVSKRYKLINSPNEEPWLFDFERDPDELVNFYDDPDYYNIIKNIENSMFNQMEIVEEPGLKYNHIKAQQKSTTPITGITLNQGKVVLAGGQSKSVLALIEPMNASNKKVIWTSENDAIANVASSGIISGFITGIGNGITTITAKTEDGEYVASCNVTVASNTLLGNSIANGEKVDGWKSNMVINETDVYTNTSGTLQSLKVEKFNFYAERMGDPLTPFIVKINGDDDFTILAVGTTRSNTEYIIGSNSFDFSTTQGTIDVADGETIAAGFLDANADGTGSGLNSVVSYNNGADEIWYSGGNEGVQSGNVAIGSAPIAGASTLTNLLRDYHFNIEFADIVPPTKPGKLVATDITKNSCKLTWTRSDDNTVVTGYEILHNGVVIANATDITVNITGLSCDNTYALTVRAKDATGNRSESSEPVLVTTIDCNQILLGNSIVDGTNLDSWTSNMVINETDIYANNSGGVQIITINKLNFYARRLADPITPFIVRVNSDNNFAVIAVGTTRNNSLYNIGLNSFAFNDGIAKTITLNNGQKIAAGFLDADADGSAGGIGSVIPYDNGGDEIWYSGGSAGTVAEGSAPTPGANTYTNLTRSYRFSIELATVSTSDTQAPSVPGTPTASNITQTSCSLTWTASTDNIGVTAYDVYQGSSVLASASTNSANITGLSCGTTYSFTVKAKDAAGNVSAASNATSVTTTNCSTQVISLGNTITDAANIDGWRSNMVINETDIYTNSTGSAQTLTISKFNFYARRSGAPVTPFVVKVNGDNNFTVLAVGTTRTSSNYSTGANSFDFSTNQPVISLVAGETIAVGFLDAYADGSGGDELSVIPFDNGGDEIWYSGGSAGNNSGSVSAGSAPNAGYATLTNLFRTYHFNIELIQVNSGPVENLALNKPATQSSGYQYQSFPASNAVNGNRTDFSSTDPDANAWWQVDLEALADILTIDVYNRISCCQDRLSDYYVFVSDTPFTSDQLTDIRSQSGVDEYYIPGQAGLPTSINVNRTGRYVRIQIIGTNYLHPAEIEVFGNLKSAVEPYSSSTSDIKVYPNPANDILNISLSGELQNNARIEITNNTGAVLKTIQVKELSNALSIEGFSSGIYIIRFINGTEVTNKLIIKE